MNLRLFLLLAFLALTACAPEAQDTPTPATTPAVGEETQFPAAPERGRLAVMTHDSFAVSEEVIRAFEAENNADVQIVQAGDAGSALNRAILAGDSPLADVFYGVDNTFLSRALNEDIFEPYDSPRLAEIPDALQLDPQNRALPVDYGDVCLNYDKAYFADQNLTPPQNLADLARPEYRSLLVVQNPATSSPGLAFLLVTIGNFGQDGYLDYWGSLAENDVLVVNDWNTAYYTEFTRHGGARPIVVSYGTSLPAEVIFAETPIDEPPTGAVVTSGSCFRQVEFVGILRGTANRALAERWVDFMLSTTFQEDLPLQMFVYPANQNAQLDETFARHMAPAEDPISLTPEAIGANREQWIQAWNAVVLR